jgi:hypothetical protein
MTYSLGLPHLATGPIPHEQHSGMKAGDAVPSPEVVNGELKYEVSKVLNSKIA